MAVTKQRKGAKVTRKAPHGDTGRSVGMKSAAHAAAQKSAYKMNGNLRILFPLARTQTDRRILTAAVNSVVAELKK